MSQPDLIADGDNGQVELYDDRVVITRKGIIPTISHLNSGEAEIPFESLARVRYKPPAGTLNGYIRFEPAGASEGFNPTDDAHTVTFDADDAPNFERLREEVPEIADLNEDDVLIETGGSNEENVDSAIQTLRERFAAGEIDREEYERRLEILQDDR